MRRSQPVSPRILPLTASLLRGAGLLALLALAMIILWQARRPDPSTGQERSDMLAGALDAGHTLEQTFTSGRDDLCAIDVFPRIPPGRLNPRYMLTLRLLESGNKQELAVTHIRLVDARARQRITFSFPTQKYSRGKAYLLRIETDTPADTVSLLSSAEDAYPGGELRQDGLPAQRDLTFRAYTALAPPTLLAELASSAPELGLLLAFCLLFGIAGAACLTLLNTWPASGAAERGLWAVGAGLAFVPLLFLLAGKMTLWVLGGLCLLASARLALAWRNKPSNPRAVRKGNQDEDQNPANSDPQGKNPAVDWALGLLFLWALVVRLLQVSDIPAPPWMDGLLHIQMTQTILDAGRMPGGLLYHIGFHTQVALLHIITDLPLPRLMVLFGQLISALGGPALYVLAKAVFSSGQPGCISVRKAALLAALALALFPSLPAYLINWGRYPFLLGLTMLPFTLSATVTALRAPPSRASLGRYALMAVMLGGQLLSHYGTLSFWLSFSLVFLAIERSAWIRQVRPRQVALAGLALIAMAVLSGYLRFGDNVFDKVTTTIAESRQVSEELDYASMWQINLRAGGTWLALAGACGAVWAAFWARKALLLSAGWFTAQAVLIAMQSPVLGFALASYANLLLALPLPLAILAGGLLAELITAPDTQSPGNAQSVDLSIVRIILRNHAWRASVLILLAAAGGLSQIGILNPTTLLYSPADEQAMEWINAHLPDNARLLVNSRYWSNTQVVPADGGGWIPVMTGREIHYLEDKNELDRLPETIVEKEISHIYLGRFSGTLARSMFEQDPERYQRVYHEAGIDIYEIVLQN